MLEIPRISLKKIIPEIAIRFMIMLEIIGIVKNLYEVAISIKYVLIRFMVNSGAQKYKTATFELRV